ncbi:MAG: DNA translocase FtsK [Clostridia bacterium]|nr:DNA translocase FtsK [Clostridia bacterium]
MLELQFPCDNLTARTDVDGFVSIDQMREIAKKLEDLFCSLKLPVKVADYKFNNVAIVLTLVYNDTRNPSKRFEAKVNELKKIQKDIELCLCCPVEISGQNNTIIIAVQSFARRSVTLKDLLSSGEFLSSNSPLTVAGGTDISGGRFVFDLESLGNLLIVGVTGAGKSTFLNDIIISILAKATPDQVQFVLMDFKGVELLHYQRLPHLYDKNIEKEPEAALDTLKQLQLLSQEREKALAQKGFYRFDYYQRAVEDDPTRGEPLPRIIIIIDEFIELYQKLLDRYPLQRANQLWKEVLSCLEAISEKTVQTGIHFVLVAQTPIAYEPDEKNNRNIEWDIIDALRFIRNRACLVTTSQDELKRIVNNTFTDKLLGEGDMYFYQGFEDRGRHIQTAKVEPEDVDKVVGYLQKKYSAE